MTGGEAVVETLIANDVKLVTGLIGSSTLEILDGLYITLIKCDILGADTRVMA